MWEYLMMWDEIKKLKRHEKDNWIRMLTPSRGVGIDFNGVIVCDVDLLEALKNSIH